MGGSQGAIFQQGEPLSNYDVIQKVPEHNVSYLKHKTNNKEYLIREFAINDKTEFAQTCEKIKNRKKMESSYLTKLQRYSEQMEDNMCSSFYKIYAMWEYPTHTLADEVNERALQKRRFQENQLFSIIASIIEGMSCLQSSGIKHQCLSTSTILFDQTGTVKVADPLTSLSPSNFDRINTNRKAKSVYISPQQCQSLKNQRPIPNRNPYKSDVFILGAIMLECGLLQGMEGIFVENFEDVDLQELSEKLEMFGKVYSKDLKLTVETMLTRDPKERMDWIGLKQYVPQKNQSDSSNKQQQQQSFNNTASSFGYKPQQTSQLLPSQQQPTKITLGGGGTKSSNPQLSFNPLPKFHPQIPKPIPQTHYNFASSLHQPTQTQPFTQPYSYHQPVQPLSNYPPPTTTTNFTSSNVNYVPPPPLNNYGFSGMNSNLYGNTTTKVSNYIVQSKPSYQRPTQEYLVSGNNNVSKANTFVPTSLVDRESASSSFPLNSQLQFKKDYLTTGTTNNYNPPTYDYQQSTHQYTSGKHPLYTQHYAQFSTYSTINPTPPLPQSYLQSKPHTHNNQKTQLSSTPSNNSPLLSQHVKDAKSITYDKNLYSSYMTQEKNSYYVGQDGGYTQVNYPNVGIDRHQGVGNAYYQPISSGNNKVVGMAVNGQGQQYEQQQQQQQQVESKSNVPHYLPNTAPVLYQPLSTVCIKEKPNIITQNQAPVQHQKPTQSQNTFTNTTHITQQQSTPQPYQYKQINPTPIVSHQQQQQQLQYVIQHFKQGSRYEGTKYQDMRHGQGKFFYQDGGMYEGNWKFNKMDGFGKLYYQSGKIAYEGNWNEDQFQGYGKLYNQQCDPLHQPFDYSNFDLIDQYWVYYEGNFIADQKDGQGKMVFSNGEFFVGSFSKDMLDGPGEFHRMNGEVVRGIWSQNQLVEVEE